MDATRTRAATVGEGPRRAPTWRRWGMALAALLLATVGCESEGLLSCAQRTVEVEGTYTGSWTATEVSATTLPYFGLDLLSRSPIVVKARVNTGRPLISRGNEQGTQPPDAEGTSRELTLTYALDGTVDDAGKVTATLTYSSTQLLSNAEYGDYSTVEETLTAEVTGTLADGELTLTATGSGPMVQTWLDTPAKTDDTTTQKSFVWRYRGTPS